MTGTPRYDLVIFDCDGVLVDSEPIVNRVFVEMLGQLGFSLDYEQVLGEFSGSSMANRLAVMQRRLAWSTPLDFIEDFDRRLASALTRDLRPVPGVTEVLARLDGRRCVASNGSPEEMRARLGHVGLLHRFEPHLFSATEVARGKPAPDLFLHAAHRMAVAPTRCAVIEDSLAGVQGAARAGMQVFGYARLTSHRVLQEAGATVFRDMSELPRLLS